MSKKTKGTILFFVITIAIIVLAWIGINALDGDSHYDSSLCTICHQNKKMEGKSYCLSCYYDAYKKVNEKKQEGSSSKTITADPKKDASSNMTSGSGTGSDSKTTSSSSNTTNGSGKTTSGSSSKKEYNTLNYDPEDYDDPDEYADDAWDEDFDDYDEAYEYWEDY